MSNLGQGGKKLKGEEENGWIRMYLILLSAFDKSYLGQTYTNKYCANSTTILKLIFYFSALHTNYILLH